MNKPEVIHNWFDRLGRAVKRVFQTPTVCQAPDCSNRLPLRDGVVQKYCSDACRKARHNVKRRTA